MLNSKLWLVATALIAFSTSVAFADKQEFAPPSVGTFDGTHYGPFTIGSTTASQVKDQFKIDKKGYDTPWSLRVSTPKGSGYRVFTLFSGPKDHDDTLSAILLQFESGPTLDMLSGDLGEKGDAYFLRRRNSDWWLQNYSDKGVVAFVDESAHLDTVYGVLLVRPSITANGVLDLSADPTQIVPVPDLHAGEPKVMHFGSIDVETYGLSHLEIRDRRIRDIRDDLEFASAQGTMVYQPGASDTYKVEFSGDYNWDNGGSVTVTCTISGECPYGPVSAKGEATEDLDKHERFDRDDDFYLDALRNARANAERNFAAAMRAAGPPTPSEARRMDWDDLFNALRQQTLTEQRVMARVNPAHPFTMFGE